MVQKATYHSHRRKELTEANRQVFSREQFENDIKVLTTQARAIATEHINLMHSYSKHCFEPSPLRQHYSQQC